MISLDGINNIYLAPGHTDMRKSVDSLAAIVQYQMFLDPFSTNLFIFCGRTKKTIKILEWSKDGFWLHTKKLLGKNKFRWPKPGEETSIIIDERQLEWLLDGLDLHHKYAHKNVNAVVQKSL